MNSFGIGESELSEETERFYECLRQLDSVSSLTLEEVGEIEKRYKEEYLRQRSYRAELQRQERLLPGFRQLYCDLSQEPYNPPQFDDIKVQLPAKGTLCPDREQLQFVMDQAGVVPHWRDLGVQLLHKDSVQLLDEIQEDYPSSVRARCTEMFEKWLQTRPDACWNQLCDALNKISQQTAADKVRKQFCTGPINYSEPASIIPQDFPYYRFILDTTECWKAEKVDLRPVIHYLSSYSSDAIVAACEENSYEGLFLAITHEKEPISLTLLEEIAKKIRSDATTHLVKQYRSMIETTSQYRPAKTSRNGLEPEVIPWLKITSGGPYLYGSTPEATSQYSRGSTPEETLPQYRSTPGVVSEFEQRSPKLNNTRLCPYKRPFQL